MTREPSGSARIHHWTGFTLAVMAAWVVVGGTLLVTRGLFETWVDGTHKWQANLIAVIGHWGLNAALTPLIVWVVRRFPIDRGRQGRALGVQLAVLLAGPVVHVLLRQTWLMTMADKPYGLGDYLRAFPGFLVNFAGLGIPPFLVVLGAANGWYFFQQYLDQTRAATALEVERIELKASLAEARLDALQAQLQPHFLFNALHALSTLILKGEPRAANEMLSNISGFLRMTLEYSESPTVPLAVELGFLDAYLAIQRGRFGDRLGVEVTVGDDARRQLVPRLILQPLVENAIQHGVAGDAAGGRIVVRAAVAGGRLTLDVEDSGPGLPPGDAVAERVGLRNIRQRLEQLYPAAHSFTLNSGQGGGVRARIVIPAIEPAADAARSPDDET